MKWLLLITAAMTAIIALVAIIGAMLPREHVASRSAVLHRSPLDVYATVRDFASAPVWRDDVKRVELLSSSEGHAAFREHTRHGAITHVVAEDRPGERLVIRIADGTLPYGGGWTFEFQPAPDRRGTLLRITEHGFVKNVVFRALARFVFGYATTIERYLRALGKRFGEEVTPQP